MRRFAALLATTALCVSVAGAAAGPADARTESGIYAKEAFAATNANRVEHKLKALKSNDCLKHAAVRGAKLMAQREEMFHQDLGAVLKACHLDAAGENVGFGYPSGTSVVNDGWMNSDGHRANILSSSFRLMGIGARKGHDGQWYVAQVFGRKA